MGGDLVVVVVSCKLSKEEFLEVSGEVKGEVLSLGRGET